jgi:hypothetical protein
MPAPERSNRSSEHVSLSKPELARKASFLLGEIKDSLSQVQEFRDAVAERIGGGVNDKVIDKFFSEDPDEREVLLGDQAFSGVKFEKDGFAYHVDYSSKRTFKVSGPATLMQLEDIGIVPQEHESRINVGLLVERKRIGETLGDLLMVSLIKDNNKLEKGNFSYERDFNTQSAAKKIDNVVKFLRSK